MNATTGLRSLIHYRSSCRRVTRAPSVSRADGMVRLDGDHVMQ
jgi:hypothetical protein